jgi:hypothetical protein
MLYKEAITPFGKQALMPARDRYHVAVKQALIKDGWQIVQEQVLFVVENRNVWIDLKASKASEQRTILIEVKGFEGRSQVDDLMAAIGKFVVYRAVIDASGGKNVPLYLTIPEKAYQNIMNEQIGKLARQQAQVKLLVFDPDREEVSAWID